MIDQVTSPAAARWVRELGTHGTDQPFLELALARKVDALVTGDKGLLCLDGKLTCPLLGAEQFLRSFDTAR